MEWSDKCFICGAHMEEGTGTLMKSIVPLEKYPDHADPEYIHEYMVCPICKEEGVLI